MNKIAAAAALVLGLTVVGTGSAQAAGEVPGSSSDNPIVVSDPSEVPEGAVEDEVSTYDTPAACDTTRSWVLTIPANEETNHEEYRYLRVVPGQYHEAVTHEESKYTRTVPGQHHDAVTHTEYHFSKFTRTKTRVWVPGTPGTEGTPAVYGPDLWWNWSPNDTQGPQDYTPDFPSDARGTWQGPHENGGPMQDTFGTFQTGGGNSPFFHREHGALITPAQPGTPGTPGHFGWSDWSEWTQWTPVTHESWELSTDPLGEPAFHAQGLTWYREWQARFDGGTRTVTDAEAYDDPDTTENTGWLSEAPEGEGWTVVDTRTVTDEAAYTDPDVTLYYVLGGEPSTDVDDASWLLAEQAPAEGWTQFDERTVGNGDSAPEVVTYYAYTDGAECEKPEGYEHNSSSSVCDHGDLVTTETTETGTPVQAEDGSWSLEETATSSQSVKQNAAKCNKVTPPTPNPPTPTPPTTPTSIDAGLDSVTPATDENTYLPTGLVTMLAGFMVLVATGLTVAHSRRRGTEK